MPFDDDTALSALGDGAWEGRIADGWYAGLGPLGGYVMALILRGVVSAADDAARQPRSLTVHFLRAPEAGPAVVRAEVARAGRSLSTVTARLEQHGELIALALAAVSAPREGPVIADAPMPAVDPPTGREVPAGGGVRTPPPFTERVTMERRFGERPFTGAEHMEVGGWMGLRETRPVDALTIALLSDAWFPAPWPRLRGLSPAPTIELTVHFRAALPLPDTLLLGRFRTTLVRDGFFDESGELWTPDGTLVAHSRQLGLLIDAEDAAPLG